MLAFLPYSAIRKYLKFIQICYGYRRISKILEVRLKKKYSKLNLKKFKILTKFNQNFATLNLNEVSTDDILGFPFHPDTYQLIFLKALCLAECNHPVQS